MVATWIKFLKKEPKEISQKIFDIVGDIINGNTRHLDIKPMNGQKNTYRCRVGDIRIVYENNNRNVLKLELFDIDEILISRDLTALNS